MIGGIGLAATSTALELASSTNSIDAHHHDDNVDYDDDDEGHFIVIL